MDNSAWLQSAVPSKPHWAQLLKLISHLRGQLQAPNFDSCCLSSWKQLWNQLQELWATNQQLFNNFSLHMESSLYIIYISVLGVGWWGHLVCFCSLLSTNTDIFWIYQLPCTWEGDRRSRPSVDASDQRRSRCERLLECVFNKMMADGAHCTAEKLSQTG